MSHKIAVLSNIHLLPETEAQIKALFGHDIHFPDEQIQPSEAELVARTGTADLVLTHPTTVITEQYLQACPSVMYIGICGTTMANVDERVTASGVTVTNVEHYGDESGAEFILMQLVYLARGMGKYQWRDMPTELMGKSLGIIGLGSVGQAIAELALAYKMKVHYYSQTRKPHWEQRGADKTVLLQASDIVVVSTPTNTVAMDEHSFSLLRPHVILVQASAGTSFEMPAFLNWIKQKGNYALFDLAAGKTNFEALKDVPGVVFPHVMGGYTREARQRMGDGVVENLKEFLK